MKQVTTFLKKYTNDIPFALFIAFIIIAFAGFFVGIFVSVSRSNEIYAKTEESLRSDKTLTVYEASIDSPLVMIKLDSIQELVVKAHVEGGSIIYKTHNYEYATIANTTIGYKATVEGSNAVWFFWP